ncbi:MAG: lamin tail domain-containing protein, partial [Chloroflexota bacterium]
WYAGALGWPQPGWYAAIRPRDLPGRGRLLIGADAAASQRQTDFGQAERVQGDIHLSYFETLMQNADFKVEFADRLYQHLFNEGALADARAQERWRALTAAIEPAGWANISHHPGLSQADWLKAQAEVLAHMDGQAARIIAQARQAGYYPAFDPPLFSQEGGLVEAGFTLEMSLPPGSCPNCTIYYTTDGSDPRLPFSGTVIPTAVAYDRPLALTPETTQVKARLWDGQTWSALHQANFSVVEQDNKLRISEIMYNPVDGDDYEFIELKNIGHNEANLRGISLKEGVRFTFPLDAPQLAPGEFATLVSNPAAFAERFPDVVIWGAYEGHLSNKGEKILLSDAAGQTLLEFEFDDDNGWPLSADGRGDSLTLVNESGDPNNPKNWQASSNLGGSPGGED